MWASEEELGGVSYWGQSEWYAGSGYVVPFPPLDSGSSKSTHFIVRNMLSSRDKNDVCIFGLQMVRRRLNC